MGYQGMHVLLIALCCTNTLTRIHITAQVTDRSCTCLPGCDFSKVCSPTPNCTRENVALGKPANVSSLWRSIEPSGPACLAVNGNTNTTYRPAFSTESNPNCIHTGENDRNAYWLVDLGQNYTIRNITVYIRSGSSDRIALVIITVDGQPCYQFPNTPPSQLQYNVICNPTRRGSVVKFYKNGDNQPQYLLNICEVQVWVCLPGLYGINCDNKCNCKEDEICDNFDGTCTRVCRNGSYGTDCSNTCGSCRDSLPCNAYNGSCLNGCLDVFIGPLCKDICRNGTYGSNCTNKCGQCKNGNYCNASNGVCLNGCEDGYDLPLCKEICKNGTYGSNCTNKCGQCKNGNNCNASNGVCLNGCEEGYVLPLCKEMCRNWSYGSDCNNTCGSCRNGRPCNASNGVCLDGCLDGFTQPLCKDICKSGFYGQHCQACGKCRDSQPCNSTNGICTNGCADGYEPPPLCNEVCKNGFYGPNCNSTCGFCNANQPCNKENGTCVDGCADGYESPECIQKCLRGMWGRNCQNACGACLGWTCRHDSGICDKGCFAGYEGEHCTVLLQQQTAAIVGSVLGAGLLIGGSIVAAVLIWLRRSMKGKRHHLPRSKDKESPGTAKDNYAMDNLNFKEDVYDKFETEKDVPRPYSVLGKESHDDHAQHSTTLENKYEKIATQSQNTSADSKPYEII